MLADGRTRGPWPRAARRRWRTASRAGVDDPRLPNGRSWLPWPPSAPRPKPRRPRRHSRVRRTGRSRRVRPGTAPHRRRRSGPVGNRRPARPRRAHPLVAAAPRSTPGRAPMSDALCLIFTFPSRPACAPSGVRCPGPGRSGPNLVRHHSSPACGAGDDSTGRPGPRMLAGLPAARPAAVGRARQGAHGPPRASCPPAAGVREERARCEATECAGEAGAA